MAFDFDSYLKKKGIAETPEVSWGEPANKDRGAGGYDFDSALDRIDSKAAAEQGYSLPEYRDLQKKSQEAAARNKGIKREKGFGDYAEDVVRGVAEQPFLRSFSKGATAGLSEPVAAGISTLIRKGMGDDKGFGDVYRDVSGEQSADFKEGASQNPIQNILGEIAGIGAPGGAFSRLYGAVGKGTQLPLMMEGSKVPMALKIAQAGLRGGAANVGFGVVNKAASDLNLQDEKWHPARDFLLGAAGDTLIGMPADWAINKLSKAPIVRRIIEKIPYFGKVAKAGREEADEEAKRIFENSMEKYKAAEAGKKAKIDTDFENEREAYKALERQRRMQHDTQFENAKQTYTAAEQKKMMQSEADATIAQRTAVEDFKNLIKQDPASSAEGLFKKVKSADYKLGQAYGDAVDPIMSKYRLKKVDATPFAKEVDDILNRFGVVDEAGNVDLESMDGFLDFDPDTKGLVNKLVSFKDGLSDGVTISKLERGVKTLQKAAQFNKGVGYRSPTEETLGDLSRRLKDFMTERVSEFASPDEIAAIQQAKAKFAEGKNILKEPLKLVGRYGARPERIARNLSSQLPASAMQDLMKLDPSMKDEFGDLFLNFMTGSSTSPRKFTKEIDYFGPTTGQERSRDILKQILGEERFAQLEGAEKNLHEAAVPWKKKYSPGEAPKKGRYEPLAPPKKGKYVPEAPPQLSESQMEEIYQTLAAWAQSPENIKKKFGAGSAPPIGSIMAPFGSRRLSNN